MIVLTRRISENSLQSCNGFRRDTYKKGDRVHYDHRLELNNFGTIIDGPLYDEDKIIKLWLINWDDGISNLYREDQFSLIPNP